MGEDAEHVENNELLDYNTVCVYANSPAVCEFTDSGLVYLLSARQFLDYVVLFLKLASSEKFNAVTDFTVIDHIQNKMRFTLMYNFVNQKKNSSLRVISKVNETNLAISLEKIYPLLTWPEREV